jgi:hypothetical protein
MQGLNLRLFAHKTNTLPTELMVLLLFLIKGHYNNDNYYN